MKRIRNHAGKLVCQADAQRRVVEIRQKGFITIIQFLTNGEMKIINIIE